MNKDFLEAVYERSTNRTIIIGLWMWEEALMFISPKNQLLQPVTAWKWWFPSYFRTQNYSANACLVISDNRLCITIRKAGTRGITSFRVVEMDRYTPRGSISRVKRGFSHMWAWFTLGENRLHFPLLSFGHTIYKDFAMSTILFATNIFIKALKIL